MNDKINIGILFGGRSGEHEISIASTYEVLAALDPKKYNIMPIFIAKEGSWHLAKLPISKSSQEILAQAQPVVFIPEPNNHVLLLRNAHKPMTTIPLDIIFPLLHGPMGEDGTVQGMFKLANIPYVGSGVAACAVGMDKALMKNLFVQDGLNTASFKTITRNEFFADPAKVQQQCEQTFAYPWFVKPANMGSSVGISKVNNSNDFLSAMKDAAQYDRKIVVEAGITNARELEISIMGNEELKLSMPGEIVTTYEFYSYDAKYADDSLRLLVPADIPEKVLQTMHDCALRAYRALDCAGYARADFLLRRDDNELFISEINTIPGFTQVSMVPKLWEAAGVPYAKLLDELIALAFARHDDIQKNLTSFAKSI